MKSPIIIKPWQFLHLTKSKALPDQGEGHSPLQCDKSLGITNSGLRNQIEQYRSDSQSIFVEACVSHYQGVLGK